MCVIGSSCALLLIFRYMEQYATGGLYIFISGVAMAIPLTGLLVCHRLGLWLSSKGWDLEEDNSQQGK